LTTTDGGSAVTTTTAGLGRFFVLTYAVTWTCFIAAGTLVRANGPSGAGPLAAPLFLLGTIAPSLVALALTARAEGETGVLALLRRVVQWRVGLRWYVFAAGYMAAIKLTLALLHRALAGEWPAFGAVAWYVMVPAIAVSTWVQAGEEIGWRGYALPRLAATLGLGPAGVALGAIWACWHLPLFFVPEASTDGQSFVVYVLQVTALSVAMTFLFWRTNGSLLLVMLMHAAVNNTKDIVPSAVPEPASILSLSSSRVAWLTVALLWLAALGFLVRMRGAALDGPIRRQRDGERG
jgi:membrane protease YdiL (CAAX protease family)